MRTLPWHIRLEFKPQDCWIGVYWRGNYPPAFDVWICVLPMLPIHIWRGWNAR